jgi:hypothetical protein
MRPCVLRDAKSFPLALQPYSDRDLGDGCNGLTAHKSDVTISATAQAVTCGRVDAKPFQSSKTITCSPFYALSGIRYELVWQNEPKTGAGPGCNIGERLVRVKPLIPVRWHVLRTGFSGSIGHWQPPS